MGYHDVAQVCFNGHVINSSFKKYPEDNINFCKKCGAQTITNCQNCKAEIEGSDPSQGPFIHRSYVLPAFCPSCGNKFPWTESKIQTAQELAKELENISDDDKEIIAQSINDLVKDTPKTELAIAKYNKILNRAGKVVGDSLHRLVVDMVSESVRKLLRPDQ